MYYINNIYLHNFDLYDMGNFWTKMCQFDTFFYYTPFDISERERERERERECVNKE